MTEESLPVDGSCPLHGCLAFDDDDSFPSQSTVVVVLGCFVAIFSNAAHAAVLALSRTAAESSPAAPVDRSCPSSNDGDFLLSNVAADAKGCFTAVTSNTSASFVERGAKETSPGCVFIEVGIVVAAVDESSVWNVDVVVVLLVCW